MPRFLDWLLRLIPLNPICVRLVQGGSRRARHMYIRAGYLALMIIVLLFAVAGGGVGAMSLRELARNGADAFTVVSFGQVGLICLLTPIFMAGAIAQEANPRTWDILLATPLNALQIVLGNLFGRLFFVLALLLSTLPLFVLTQSYGGVPGRSILVSYAIAACSALVVAAVAVTLSVTRTAGRRAVVVFYITVVAYLVATYAIDSLLRVPAGPASNASLTTVVTPLNPFLALEALLYTNRYQPHDLAGTGAGWLRTAWLQHPVGTFGWLCVLVSFVLIVFSTARLRVIGAKAGTVSWWRRLLRVPPRGGERPARHVGSNPIVWRESKAKGNSPGAIAARWGFVGLGLLVAIVLLTVFHTGMMTLSTLRIAIAAVVGAEIMIILLTALNLSAVAVSKEREDGSLDIILTTPIQPGPYLAGKLRGLIQYLLPMIVVPVSTLALIAVYVLADGLGTEQGVIVQERVGTSTTVMQVPLLLPEVALAMPLVLAAFVAFYVMIGLQWSIKTKGTIGSFVGAVGVAAVLTGLPGVICGWWLGSSVPVLGGAFAAVTPVNLLAASVNPGDFIGPTIDNGVGGPVGPGARSSIVVGAVVAALIYGAIVVAMHTSMKKSFMMTVRKLAGQN